MAGIVVPIEDEEHEGDPYPDIAAKRGVIFRKGRWRDFYFNVAIAWGLFWVGLVILDWLE